MPPLEEFNEMCEVWDVAFSRIPTDIIYGLFHQVLAKHQGDFMITTGAVLAAYADVKRVTDERTRQEEVEAEVRARRDENRQNRPTRSMVGQEGYGEGPDGHGGHFEYYLKVCILEGWQTQEQADARLGYPVPPLTAEDRVALRLPPIGEAW